MTESQAYDEVFVLDVAWEEDCMRRSLRNSYSQRRKGKTYYYYFWDHGLAFGISEEKWNVALIRLASIS